MYLAPSDIRYSQDSISNVFGYSTMHGGELIGETLDELIRNPNTVKQIPTITVFNRHGRWYTTDNRRLWVFRKAEELEILSTIPVIETNYFDASKFTTFNEGKSVQVRRYGPGGSAWRRRKRQLEDGIFWLEPTENLSNRQATRNVPNPNNQFFGLCAMIVIVIVILIYFIWF